MAIPKNARDGAWIETTSSLKSKALVVLCMVCAATILSACRLADDSNVHILPATQDTAHVPATLDAQHTTLPPASQPPTTQTPTATPTPRLLTLAVPARWAPATELASLAASSARWQITVSDDPASAFDLGTVDVALADDTSGIFVAQRPMALSVPFYSSWVSVREKEAWSLVDDPLPGVMVVDWAEIPYASRALRVEGMLPGEAGYPLQQTWSLEFREDYEAEATQLAEKLGPYLSQDDVVYVAAVGDVMLDRALGQTLLGDDLTYPFSEVAGLFAAADLAVGNLESALGDSGTPEKKGYTFQAPPQAAQALAIAGFDLMSLANNHALDYGANALMEGIDLLEMQGIGVVGAGENRQAARAPFLIQINNLSLAFLAYVDVPVEVRGFDTRRWVATEDKAGVAWADPKQIQEDIQSVQPQADLIIVLLHSGYEGVVQPSPPQEAAAHTAIDAGAHLVIGHHAHVLQGIEFYNGGVIVYGLGNFAFEDGGFDQSAILQLWLDRDGVRTLGIIPVLLDTSGRPNPAREAQASLIRQWFYSTTAVVDTR
jgi:poly-gamma-glutamate capsule biosynthesis protein CapA/YwtB (metallophosphatase superfamily)